jgi:hypothetical protein
MTLTRWHYSWSCLKGCAKKEVHLKSSSKAIYGLKQFGCIWYIKIDRFLQEQGMTRSASNHNLYFCRNESLFVVIMSYVDDLLLTRDDTTKL